jgi:hypothetical protein
MSNTQYAFVKKEKVPSVEDWQKAIDSLNFKIKLILDLNLKPFIDEGFLPCELNVIEDAVGFGIFYSSAEDVHGEDENLKEIIGDNDYCISMSWGGSMNDCVAVMIAGFALKKEFGAVVSYEGEPPLSEEEFMCEIEEVFVEITA